MPSDDIQKQRIQALLELTAQTKQGKILDIGCQSGELCSHLHQQGHQPFGVEIVRDLVEQAKSKYPSIDFRCADCEMSLPFSDKFFDIVWAGDVIEHIRFTDTFVNEINRVLRLGGLFVLTTPMHNRIKNLLVAMFGFEHHFDPEFPHLRFYTLRSLCRVLHVRGFVVRDVRYLGRVRPIAKSMFVVAEKLEDKQAMSKHRY